jgi:hypothetical protein
MHGRANFSAASMIGLLLICGPDRLAAQDRTPQESLHVVLPFDAIPAIDRPTFVPAAKATAMSASELVIGLVGTEEQRAYSTWHLDRHEIVNDVFEGRPIAVTW